MEGIFETLTGAIANLGFPIAVCVYLFYSNEQLRKTIDNNTKTIETLKDTIITLSTAIKELTRGD